ncbi:MAG TPA: hypothetical protein VF607_17455 [Verrucomicrobiae bacterium]
MAKLTINLASGAAIICIRALAFIPAYFAVAFVLDKIISGKLILYSMPSMIWVMCYAQFALGILCLMPYPKFLFRNNTKSYFIAVIVASVGFGFYYAWMPIYYRSPQLISHTEALRRFENAKLNQSYNGYSSSDTENGVLLWWVEKPNYDWFALGTQTFFASAPLLLFCIRNYQVKNGFSWRDFTE